MRSRRVLSARVGFLVSTLLSSKEVQSANLMGHTRDDFLQNTHLVSVSAHISLASDAAFGAARVLVLPWQWLVRLALVRAGVCCGRDPGNQC